MGEGTYEDKQGEEEKDGEHREREKRGWRVRK